MINELLEQKNKSVIDTYLKIQKYSSGRRMIKKRNFKDRFVSKKVTQEAHNSVLLGADRVKDILVGKRNILSLAESLGICKGIYVYDMEEGNKVYFQSIEEGDKLDENGRRITPKQKEITKEELVQIITNSFVDTKFNKVEQYIIISENINEMVANEICGFITYRDRYEACLKASD